MLNSQFFVKILSLLKLLLNLCLRHSSPTKSNLFQLWPLATAKILASLFSNLTVTLIIKKNYLNKSIVIWAISLYKVNDSLRFQYDYGLNKFNVLKSILWSECHLTRVKCLTPSLLMPFYDNFKYLS